ncbi:hypothetical protein [Streptomyces sp. NPDC093591]|uniref:hypothetical protein n=1 Tax=Streptomyces sp. NPDC093591 TaxID=3366044 RepID=UPI003818BE65
MERSYAEGRRLRHLPTSAGMTVTGDRDGRLHGPTHWGSNYARLRTSNVPLHAEEHAVLNTLPRFNADTQTLSPH